MTLLNRIPFDAMLAVGDRYFAPVVVLPFADEMARRLSRISNGPVLELAAGSGVLTQAIAASLSAGMTIISTDPSAEMIRHAAARPGMARIAWQQADPMALPFKNGTFGIVACHLGIPLMADHVAVFREARRVLRLGGRFVFSVLGDLPHNPVAACVQQAMNAAFPSDPPLHIADGLHGYANQQVIDDDLTIAGFTDAIYAMVDLPFFAAGARDVALGYCLGTKLRAEIELRAKGDVEPVLEAATRALQQRFGTGTIETSMRAQFISAAG